jgi:cathepsin X
MKLGLASVLVFALPSAFANNKGGCGMTYKDLTGKEAKQLPRSEVSQPLGAPLPVLDWRNVNGTNWVTPPAYQLLPSPCGSCWAFASTGALADRYKIALENKYPDVHLSVQALVDCGAGTAGSCNGGSALAAYEFMAENGGLPDATCSPYIGHDNSNWSEIDCVDRQCRTCDRFGTCSYVPAAETELRYEISDYGSVVGVESMKAELRNGPIACLMYAHSDSFEDYKGGVIQDYTAYDGITHVVVVVGYGETADGMGFWVVKNSFGTNWGENGFYRQEIGKDIYNMESNECAWATVSEDSVRVVKERMPL